MTNAELIVSAFERVTKARAALMPVNLKTDECWKQMNVARGELYDAYYDLRRVLFAASIDIEVKP